MSNAIVRLKKSVFKRYVAANTNKKREEEYYRREFPDMFDYDREELLGFSSLINPPRKPKAGQKPSLYIDLDERLGNLYCTLKAALVFSLYYGIEPVFFRSPHGLLRFPEDGRFVVPVSSFFPLRNTLLIVPRNSNFFFPHHDISRYGAERPELKRKVLALFGNALRYDRNVSVPEDTLVVHIRSGDIFSARPHPAYHQPPLAWYTLCVEDFRKHYPSASIILVHEDAKNPCVNALRDWCVARGIAVSMQSKSLYEDYSWLMNARYLVESWGTFSAPARDLNRHLKGVYAYRDEYAPAGCYIERRAWTASPEQIALMTQLDASRLSVPPDLFEQARAAVGPHVFWENGQPPI